MPCREAGSIRRANRLGQKRLCLRALREAELGRRESKKTPERVQASAVPVRERNLQFKTILSQLRGSTDLLNGTSAKDEAVFQRPRESAGCSFPVQTQRLSGSQASIHCEWGQPRLRKMQRRDPAWLHRSCA